MPIVHVCYAHRILMCAYVYVQSFAATGSGRRANAMRQHLGIETCYYRCVVSAPQVYAHMNVLECSYAIVLYWPWTMARSAILAFD